MLPDDIVVSDDGSGIETIEVVSYWRNKLPIYHEWHEDRGFRKNRILNRSVLKCTGDYIIFLDGDCIPHSKFIQDHEKYSESGFFIQGRRAFIKEKHVPDVLENYRNVSYYISTFKMTGIFKALRFPKPIIRVNQEQRGLIGCNLSMWKEDLIRINGFDESYNGWGVGEDSDVCTRLYNLGLFRKFIYGRAIVLHLNHPEQDKKHHHKSLQKLKKVLRDKSTWCQKGISHHKNNEHLKLG